MLYVGCHFRAPARRDVKEWAKLEVLMRAGLRFFKEGGNGVLPATAKEARLARARRSAPVAYIRINNKGKRVYVHSWRQSHYIVTEE